MSIYLIGLFLLIVVVGWKYEAIAEGFDGDGEVATAVAVMLLIFWPVVLVGLLTALMAYIPFKLGQSIPKFLTKLAVRREIKRALKESQ